jgi:hypothetical protein
MLLGHPITFPHTHATPTHHSTDAPYFVAPSNGLDKALHTTINPLHQPPAVPLHVLSVSRRRAVFHEGLLHGSLPSQHSRQGPLQQRQLPCKAAEPLSHTPPQTPPPLSTRPCSTTEPRTLLHQRLAVFTASQRLVSSRRRTRSLKPCKPQSLMTTQRPRGPFSCSSHTSCCTGSW